MAAYGDSQYGNTLYGIASDSDTPTASVPDLMKYLPPYYQDSAVMQAIMDADAKELGNLWYALDDILAQFFVATATWGLDLWETELGLDTDPSKSYTRRREVIMAKLRGARTTTKEMIKNAAAAFSGGEVDVIEYPKESRFVVQFIGVLGIPENMVGFIAMLEQIKPAHLAYSFKYTYTTWAMAKSLTWGGAKTKTWAQLRTYEGGE